MTPRYAASLLLAVMIASIQSVASAALNSSSLVNSNSTINATAPVVTLPVSTNKDAGLPGVVYAGVAIGVVAVAGFFVECCLHKRNYWSKRNDVNAGLNANLPSNRVV